MPSLLRYMQQLRMVKGQLSGRFSGSSPKELLASVSRRFASGGAAGRQHRHPNELIESSTSSSSTSSRLASRDKVDAQQALLEEAMEDTAALLPKALAQQQQQKGCWSTAEAWALRWDDCVS